MTDTDAPLEAIRHILEYLDRLQEEERLNVHVRADVVRVREWLEAIGENKPSRERVEFEAKLWADFVSDWHRAKVFRRET
jgi:hypothetical protein